MVVVVKGDCAARAGAGAAVGDAAAAVGPHADVYKRQPFVREAFQRYDEGATMTQIRDWLNEQGVKNTRGQKMCIRDRSRT